jgi:hypothetical protein
MALSRAVESPASPSVEASWLLRFGVAFALQNTLLTFENRWPGFGVLYVPRLSFELYLSVVLLMGRVAWRGALSAHAATVLGRGRWCWSSSATTSRRRWRAAAAPTGTCRCT